MVSYLHGVVIKFGVVAGIVPELLVLITPSLLSCYLLEILKALHTANLFCAKHCLRKTKALNQGSKIYKASQSVKLVLKIKLVSAVYTAVQQIKCFLNLSIYSITMQLTIFHIGKFLYTYLE